MVILADNTEFSKHPQQRMTMHKILSQTLDMKYMVSWGPPQNIQILGQQGQNPGYIDTTGYIDTYRRGVRTIWWNKNPDLRNYGIKDVTVRR